MSTCTSSSAPPPLTRAQSHYCDYPPGTASRVVQVVAKDLSCLEPKQILNDNIIDFYLRWVGLDFRPIRTSLWESPVAFF